MTNLTKDETSDGELGNLSRRAQLTAILTSNTRRRILNFFLQILPQPQHLKDALLCRGTREQIYHPDRKGNIEIGYDSLNILYPIFIYMIAYI